MGKCGYKTTFAIFATMKMVFGDQQLFFANFITGFKVQGIIAKSYDIDPTLSKVEAGRIKIQLKNQQAIV